MPDLGRQIVATERDAEQEPHSRHNPIAVTDALPTLDEVELELTHLVGRQLKYWAVRAGAIEMPAFDVPRWVVWGAAFAMAYMLLMFFWLFAVYGEGSPELRNGREVWIVRDSVVRVLAPGSISTLEAWELRIFSAAWIAFGLGIAAIYHRAEVRIRAYREALTGDDDRRAS